MKRYDYDWKCDIREAEKKILTAINCIENSLLTDDRGYDDILKSVLFHLQESVSLTGQL